MKVIGHDPGVDFGLTVLDGFRLEVCVQGSLRCEGPSRLAELFDWVDGFIAVHRPGLYVVEDYSFGSRMKGSGAYSTGEMGGVIRLACAARQVPLLCVAPASLLKFITGSGKHGGDKSATPLAVFKRWGVECRSSHAAESYGLARLGASIYEIEKWPEFQEEVLDVYRTRIDENPGTSGVPVGRRDSQAGRLRRALTHFDSCPEAQAGLRASKQAQEDQRRRKEAAKQAPKRKTRRKDQPLGGLPEVP